MKEVEYKIDKILKKRNDKFEVVVKHRVLGSSVWDSSVFVFKNKQVEGDEWLGVIEETFKVDNRSDLKDIEDFVGKTFYVKNKDK